MSSHLIDLQLWENWRPEGRKLFLRMTHSAPARCFGCKHLRPTPSRFSNLWFADCAGVVHLKPKLARGQVSGLKFSETLAFLPRGAESHSVEFPGVPLMVGGFPQRAFHWGCLKDPPFCGDLVPIPLLEVFEAVPPVSYSAGEMKFAALLG